MTGRIRAGALAVAVTIGVVLLVLASASGPPRFFGHPNAHVQHTYPTAFPSTSPSPTGKPVHPPTRHHQASSLDLSWLGTLLAWAMLAVLATLVLAGLAFAWRHRPRRHRQPSAEFEVLPIVMAGAALEAGGGLQSDALESGAPRNGIVACWLRVEQAVADAGLPRQPAETSSEFTVRVLHRLDLGPRAVADLARLYREARFSDHPMGEPSRAAAREALASIHSDLRTTTGREVADA